jgi:RNA polymerase sigma-70 factor (ECF subfamily)
MERMEPTDAAVVARAQAGDTEAFRWIVDRHSRRVFRLAFRMTGNEEDAEDVVQETFLRAFRRLHQFQGRAELGSWLFRIGANCAYDLLRGRGRRVPILEPNGEERLGPDDLPAAEAGPDRQVFAGELQARIRAVMARMSEMERAAFSLRHFEGMTTQEIGLTLGLEGLAVKQAVCRAVRKLRVGLAGLVEPAVPRAAGG